MSKWNQDWSFFLKSQVFGIRTIQIFCNGAFRLQKVFMHINLIKHENVLAQFRLKKWAIK